MVSLRVPKHHNVVIMVVDSRRNDMKCRYESPASVVRLQKAKSVIQRAKLATPDAERTRSFCASDWRAERDTLDKAQKEVATYDRILIALLREWIVDRQYVMLRCCD